MIGSLVLAALFSKTVGQDQVLRAQHINSYTYEQVVRLTHARPLTYVARGGATLRGLLFPAANPRAPYVLFFYGNADLAAYESDRLTWLRRLGYNAMCFDYRGYGFSDGVPDAARIRQDSVDLYDDLVRNIELSHAPAFVYGWSLGTQMAIHVAAQRKVRALVLQAPAASAQEEIDWLGAHQLGVTGRIVKLVPSGDVRTLFQGSREIASVHAPLIVIHGADDATVPAAQGREVFAAAAATDKRFVEVPRAGHSDLKFDRPPAGPALAEFLRTH